MTAGRFRVLAAKGDSAKMPKPNDHLATFFLMCEKISREAAHVICTYNQQADEAAEEFNRSNGPYF